MGKTGIKVIFTGERVYDEAKAILREFTRNETYLKSIIKNHVPEVDTRDLDYSGLLKYAYVIKGVAQNIVKSQKSKESLDRVVNALKEGVKNYSQLELFNK